MSLGTAMHAARRAADVVFVLQNKQRLGYQVLVDQANEVLHRYGEQSKITYADLDDLKVVSRKLLAVFAADDAQTAATMLNAVLAEYAYAPRISGHDTSPWHLHVDRDDNASWAEWFAASSALALAILLAEKQRNPGGLCASPICGKPFIDQGKGGGRTYCSPRCATRERVALHRKRHTDGP